MKQTEEEIRLKTLADLQFKMESLKERITQLESEEKAINSRIRSLFQTDPHLQQIQAEHQCLEMCRVQLKALMAKKKELQVEIDTARQRLGEAAKERKKIEILKDNHFENYLKEERVKEQKMMDEIGTRLYRPGLYS